MPNEPVPSKQRNLLQRTRLLEQVGRTRDDLDAHLRMFTGAPLRRRRYIQHPFGGRHVQLDHLFVVPTNDEQCRRSYGCERTTGQVRPSSARHHGLHALRTLRRCDQRGTAASARAKQTDRQARGRVIQFKPVNRADKPLGEKWNVKADVSRAKVDFLFRWRKQVDQQRRESAIAEYLRNVTVTRTEPAATAAMREEHHSDGVTNPGRWWPFERTFQRDRASRYVDRTFVIHRRSPSLALANRPFSRGSNGVNTVASRIEQVLHLLIRGL